jgi:energy-coupling factor transporter transmembrane protein EcfT
MTNWYKIFYWLTVAHNFKTFFTVMIILFTAVTVIAAICYFLSTDKYSGVDDQKMSRKWIWWSSPFTVLFWMLFLFTPSKTDTLLIIAGGAVGNFITSDSSSKAIPSDITNFIHMKLKLEASDVGEEMKAQLGLQSPKEKYIHKLKNMTSEQIIEYLERDTTTFKP